MKKNKMEKYEITIAIPSYKNIETLKKAIDSVYGLKEIEGISWKLLISEDSSEKHKDIELLVKSYENNKIKYVFHNPRLGMVDNWNYCILNSDTELVALLHDDDYLLPEYLCWVKRILDSNLNWDCILFDHEFEVDGVLQKNEIGKLKKLYTVYMNEKYRKVSEKEYLIGGYNYIAIPTCGILYRKSSIVKFGGYATEDGYSADEQFVERFVRKGGKVLYINKKLGVYTYRTNKNLSSNFEIQKKFVYENIKHRKEISNEKGWLVKKKISFWNECMTLYQVGKWKNILVPEMNITFGLKVKSFFWMIICRIYQYSKICSYKHWK